MSDSDTNSDKTEQEAVSAARASGAATEVEKPDAKAKKALKKPQSNSIVCLNGRVNIDTKKRVQKYDHGVVRAYAASPVKGITPLFVYICERHLVPRHKKIEPYKSIVNPNLCTLVDSGFVFWPPAGEERFVLVYQDNLGQPLIGLNDEKVKGIRQDILMENILQPLVNLLQDFRDKDFVHGSIRANNVYDGGANDYRKLVLGECLSSPSGFFQATEYETIERGMADSIARGPGTQSDDLYSLGVLVAILLRSTDPLVGMSADEIVKYKLEVGSYAAITGKDRFTGSILELLRGLLSDDYEQRWTLDDVIVWLDGRRLSPKQGGKKHIAPRALKFANQKYTTPRVLAMDLEMSPAETRRIVDDGDLKNWIMRSLELPKLQEQVEVAISAAASQGTGVGYDDRLVAGVSMAIDGLAPVRFRGLRVHPDGVGSALAEAVVLKQDLNVFAEMFMQGIVVNWIKMQENPFIDIPSLIGRYDGCRSYIKQAKIGMGLERCLYTLNPECPCLSFLVGKYYISMPEDILYAYEEICKNGAPPNLFIDRHIAAFIVTRDQNVIESSIVDINAAEYYKQFLGNLKCFGTIQKRGQLPFFPHLAKAFADKMGVIYKRYHDKKVRDALKKNIDTYAAEGNLIKMAALLDNEDFFRRDLAAFKQAMKEYHDLRNEMNDLNVGLADKASFGISTGQEAAAIVSCIVSSIIIVVVAFIYLSDKALF